MVGNQLPYVALVFFLRPTKSHRLIHRTIEVVTRSPITHVAIGQGDVVLDPTIEGNRFWPSTPYMLGKTDLLWCVEVPLPRLLDFTPHEQASSMRARALLPIIARWSTIGRHRGRDCVSEVAQCIRNAGGHVPTRIVSPQQLFDHFRRRGCNVHDFGECTAPPAASDGEPARRGLPPCLCPDCTVARHGAGPA